MRTASCCTTIILAEPHSNKQEALRLAEAQVPKLQLRRADALIGKLYLNAKDAAWVYRLASLEFAAKSEVNTTTTCRIHGGGGFPSQREILLHERTRILHSWYFLKLYAESLKPLKLQHDQLLIQELWAEIPLEQQHHQSLTQELWAISSLQSYVLWSMVIWLCERMDNTAQEVRISLPIPCAHRRRPIIHPPSPFLRNTLLGWICPALRFWTTLRGILPMNIVGSRVEGGRKVKQS